MSPRRINQAILFVFPYLGFINSNDALARGHVCLPAAPEVCHDLVKLRHARWEPGRDGALRLVARENATRVFTPQGRVATFSPSKGSPLASHLCARLTTDSSPGAVAFPGSPTTHASSKPRTPALSTFIPSTILRAP
jgi:hypothetical protein